MVIDHSSPIVEQDREDHAPAPPASRRLEVCGAAIALGLSVLLLVLARDIDVRTETGGVDPRWWPELLALAGIVLSGLLLVLAVVRRPMRREDIEAATRSGRLRFGLTVALTFLYVFVWPVTGFVPATAGLLVAVVGIFGGRGVKALLLFPALLTASLYGVFHTLLAVPL